MGKPPEEGATAAADSLAESARPGVLRQVMTKRGAAGNGGNRSEPQNVAYQPHFCDLVWSFRKVMSGA